MTPFAWTIIACACSLVIGYKIGGWVTAVAFRYAFHKGKFKSEAPIKWQRSVEWALSVLTR